MRIVLLMAGLLVPAFAAAQTQAPAPGFAPFIAAGTTTSRTPAVRAADFLNVLDFGADPTGIADSLPAFNSAAAAVPSGQALRMIVPRGVYRMSATFAGNGRSVVLDIAPGTTWSGTASPAYNVAASAGALAVGTGSGTVAAGDDGRLVGAVQTGNNLSDLASPSAARINLGLGPLSMQSAAAVAITGGVISGADVSAAPVTAVGSSTSRTMAARAADTVKLLDFGARCDVRQVHDLANSHVWVYSTAGSASVSFVGTGFQAADIGKRIVVTGIGSGGYPLAAAIVGVASAIQVTLSVPAAVTTSNLATVVSYGSDDSAAFASAFAAIPQGGTIEIPRGACGVATPIALPSIVGVTGYPDCGIHLRGQGRGASVLVALANINAVAQEGTGWHLQARWSDVTVDATGVAAYALDLQGGYEGIVRGVALANGLTAAIRVGDGTHSAQGVIISDSRLLNDLTSFPGTPAMPPFNLLVNGTDNHFSHVDASGASSANFRDTVYGNNFYVAAHGFGPAQYVYWFNGNTSCSGCEVDGATVAGARMDGSGNVWTGGRLFFTNQSTSGVTAFSLGAGGNTIVWPSVANLAGYQLVANTAGAPRGNTVLIAGATPIIAGQNTLMATTTDATTATTLTLDGMSASATNTIWLGNYSAVAVRGTLVVRDGANNNAGAWDVGALFTVSSSGAAPVLIGSSVTALFASAGITLGAQPQVQTTSSSVVSFAIVVQGVAGHTMHWTFVPTLAGAS